MKHKRFTLVELIITFVIISTLAMVVTVKIVDIKNKGIASAMGSNTSYIQLVVDKYTLANKGKYPVKDGLIVNLENPQLVDLNLLKEKGYIKKDLDTSNIKTQYYWVDIFGIVWGSTENTVEDVQVTQKSTNNQLEFITPEGAYSYKIYEVTGYNKNEEIIDKKKLHRKLIKKVKLNGEQEKVTFEMTNSSMSYLISVMDKYGQETAPVGYAAERVIAQPSAKPTLTITPVKNNNIGREVFTDQSIIEWTHNTVDQNGKEIIDVDWIGANSNYAIGTHTINARALNSDQVWSEWSRYTLEIFTDKPVAKITKSLEEIRTNVPVEWSTSQSTDPDGDEIVQTEWRGNKQNIYTQSGTYTLGARVQDSEGNWSDWVDYAFEIKGTSTKIYRIEAEDKSNLKSAVDITESTRYKNGYATMHSANAYLEFKFEGTGFKLEFSELYSPVDVIIDNKIVYPLEGAGISTFPLDALPLGSHTVRVVNKTNATVIVDYLDVYSSDDLPIINSLGSYSIKKNDLTETEVPFVMANEYFVPRLNEQMEYRYELKKDAFVSVEILDQENTIIKKIQPEKYDLGGSYENYVHVWDGKDNNGHDLPSGQYQFLITAWNSSKTKKVEKRHAIYSNNEFSNYRLEAEDPSTIKKNLKANNRGSASGKTVMSFESSSSYLEFTFTGIGFDAFFDTVSSNGILKVDGKIVMDYSNLKKNSKNIKTTIRGLSYGKHTVRMEVSNSNDKILLDYFDIYQ